MVTKMHNNEVTNEATNINVCKTQDCLNNKIEEDKRYKKNSSEFEKLKDVLQNITTVENNFIVFSTLVTYDFNHKKDEEVLHVKIFINEQSDKQNYGRIEIKEGNNIKKGTHCLYFYPYQELQYILDLNIKKFVIIKKTKRNNSYKVYISLLET